MPKIKFNNRTLDRYQTKAVLSKSKSTLVVAAAGSGKTFTIAAKINYLVNNKNVNYNKILCISFTNESVNDMLKTINENNLNIRVLTFHKFAMSLIDMNNYKIVYPSLLDYITDEFFNMDNDLSPLIKDYIEDYSVNLDYLKKSVTSFIHTLKSYGYDIYYLLDLVRKNITYEDKLLLTIIIKVYILYEEELSSLNMIDFDDIIIKATKRVDTLNYFKYDYIIIDEYQDTSVIRYNLLKKLYDKFDINIMAVGDDFQSIYRFNGCNIDLFIKFKRYFNKSKIIKLKYTYRNPKDIVNISSRFIMKNNYQLRKRLISTKYVDKSINIVYTNNITDTYYKVIDNLDNILVLGRNNDDINLINNGDISYNNKNIKYLTVHKSKGLEEDYVIVINLIKDKFPSTNKEYDIFKYIKGRETYPFEEERRLFYVAITRCKKKVFLLTKKGSESIFIKELIKDYKFKINIFSFK